MRPAVSRRRRRHHEKLDITYLPTFTAVELIVYPKCRQNLVLVPRLLPALVLVTLFYRFWLWNKLKQFLGFGTKICAVKPFPCI